MKYLKRLFKRRVCPICGNAYSKPPALSRTDNRTSICPACGARQALASLNLDKDEIERIIAILRQYNAI